MEEAKQEGAHVAEIRGDHLESPEILPQIVARRPLPVLVTVRPRWEGGRWDGTEGERVRTLESACAAGAEYVDVEFRAYKDFARHQARLVLSYHDFAGIPSESERLISKMTGLDPFLLKFAVTARGAGDLARCVRLQRSLRVPSSVIAMGEAGQALRILYRKYGGFMTYASLRAGAETAEGQVPVAELAGAPLDEETEVYAVVGMPVSHSKSPVLFEAAFRALGRNARYVRIPLEDPRLFREVAESLDLRGASVTIPHKERIETDERDEASREIGAVNTVVMRGGRSLGFNTDAPAVADAIGEVEGKSVLVLGSGGAARAIAWGLSRTGARVWVSSRSGKSLGYDLVPWTDRGGAKAEIVVNATSVGMGTDESPYPRESWRGGMTAFDVVYTPRETRFLREARAAGARAIEGVEMFLRQAALQHRLFTGEEMPERVIAGFRGSTSGTGSGR